jgi:hypothetical protein
VFRLPPVLFSFSPPNKHTNNLPPGHHPVGPTPPAPPTRGRSCQLCEPYGVCRLVAGRSRLVGQPHDVLGLAGELALFLPKHDVSLYQRYVKLRFLVEGYLRCPNCHSASSLLVLSPATNALIISVATSSLATCASSSSTLACRVMHFFL